MGENETKKIIKLQTYSNSHKICQVTGDWFQKDRNTFWHRIGEQVKNTFWTDGTGWEL